MQMKENGPYQGKTVPELIRELEWLKQRMAYLERIESEYRQAKEAFCESEEKYHILLDNSPDPIFSFTPEGRYIYVNQAFAEGVGKTVEQIAGKFIWDVFSPEEAEKRFSALSQVFRSGEEKVIEVRVPRPDADRFYITTITPVKNVEGKVLSAICSSKEITERKRAEEERQALEERLQRSEKMEGLGRLAGGVAHDLNNVLGVLVGYAELLSMRLPEDDPCRAYADSILRSSIRGAAIVQDLLSLARRGVTVSEVVNMNLMVSDYLKTPEHEKLRSYHPGVKIRTNLEEKLLNIQGSPVHLGKVLLNLVSNAAEAISGEGQITIRTENRYLDRPVRGYDHIEEGDYVVLAVEDSGNGISSTDMKRIFEPFYTKKIMGRSGTGLGLAVVWGSVKDHRGYIDVQSEEGKGACFSLYFPVTREALVKSPTALPLEAYAGRGETILVVDDVADQRELAKAMLSGLGYAVCVVSGGEDAVEFIRGCAVDLIVLDMIMDPGIDGFETYRRILEIRPQQKAVIVSGYSETERVKRTQALGAGAYVRKPYLLETIGLAVKKELEKPFLT